MNSQQTSPTVNAVIIDYGMGNLFSIKHACNHVGMDASVSSDANDIAKADILILPGVGAFGNAMATLHKLDLVSPILDYVEQGKLLAGVCLGQQILMEESCEFGSHKGLGLIKGTVTRLEAKTDVSPAYKVPHVGWNSLWAHREEAESNSANEGCPLKWQNTALKSIGNGDSMYFVHSYYVTPENPDDALTWTKYGDTVFCSSVMHNNVVAFQHHPERSGPSGLSIYNNLKLMAPQFGA